MKKILLLPYFIATIATAQSQLKTGAVIDTIVCKGNRSQSYAAFVPSNYNPSTPWPIIYFFDPVARGSEPVKKYAEVADELGYILVCSNNSQNGPINDSYIAADALFLDTENRFTIDKDRIYTSGFSGGSRVALAIAINTNQIAGVLGVGATEPISPDFRLLRKQNFKYVGLVGILDKNYDEHRHFKNKLDGLGVSNLLITSNLDHDWASSDDFRIGLLWMEKRENRKKLLFEAIKDKLLQANDSMPACEKYELATLANQAANTNLIPTIDPKEYKKALKAEGKLLEKEYAVKKQLFDSINFLLTFERIKKTTLDWIQLTSRRIKKLEEKDKSFENRVMYHRVLTASWGRAFEQARLDIPQKRYERALVGMEIYNTITKNALITNWWKSRIYSLMGKTEQSLACIEIVLQQGFNRKDLLYSSPDLENVRNAQGFKELVEKYQP